MYLGLGDKKVNKIEIYNSKIYAATSNGMYSKNLNSIDTNWNSLGIAWKNISDFIIFDEDTILASSYYQGIPNPDWDTIFIFISYNGGNNWNNFQNGFGGDAMLRQCIALENNPEAPDTIYASNSMCIAKSTDRGYTWEEKYLTWNHNMQYAQLSYVGLDGTIWGGGMNGIWEAYGLKSTDYGNSWDYIWSVPNWYGVACYSILPYPNNPTKLLAGLSGNILSSNNNGETWEASFDPEQYQEFMDLEISPGNNNHVYAASKVHSTGNEDRTRVYISNDFGTSWDTINYLESEEDFWTYDLEIVESIDTNDLYFATDKGVYKYSHLINPISESSRQKEYSWSVYPNPFHSTAILNFNITSNSVYVLNLYNSQGQLQKTISNIQTESLIIDRTGLNNGLYFFQLSTKNQIKAQGKLIIN